jgi:AraC family transcriptional activator of tynA and feaB
MLSNERNSGFQAYCEAVRENVFPIRFSLADRRQPFGSGISTQSFGAIDVTELTAPRGLIGKRPGWFPMNSSAHSFILTIFRYGMVQRSIRGSTFNVHKDCVSLLDSRCSFEANHLQPSCSLSIRVPGVILRPILGVPEDYCGYPIDAQKGISAIFRSYLYSAWEERHNLTDADKASVSKHILDYIERIAKKSPQSFPITPSTRDEIVFEKALGYIDLNLSNQDLNVERVAEALGISRARLYASARGREDSLGKCILTKRLERCRQALSDPQLAKRGITAIAFDWGFNDAAHFSRTFKLKYGVAPSKYRLSTLGAPVGNSE